MFLKSAFIYLEPSTEAPIQIVALQITLISLSVFDYRIMENKGEILKVILRALQCLLNVF